MNRLVTTIVGVLLLAATAATASAALRAPQVSVLGGTLQAYFNGLNPPENINVLTDQQDIQRWTSTVSGNSTFTLMIELTGNLASNSIGLYNAGLAVPPLYLVFPGAATAGWHALASFQTGPDRVVVSLFDDQSTFMGQTIYLGADRNDFGFYLQGLGGTFFTQDARNSGGAAQALTYSGTGINAGCWWLCWEESPLAGSDSDFDDAVLFLESVNPTPVSRTSWGKVKSIFR